MNFKSKMVWIATSSLFILAVIFTVISLTNFTQQEASAQDTFIGFLDSSTTFSIKVKGAPIQPPMEVSDNSEKTVKELITSAFKNETSRIRELFPPEHDALGRLTEEPDWGIYVIFKPKGKSISISITLTHNNKFMLNYLKIYSFTDNRITINFTEIAAFICNIIEKKMKNPSAIIISPDDSVITN